MATPLQKELIAIVDRCLTEDIGEGDHTTLSTIPETGVGKAQLIVKDEGIIAGIALAKIIFERFDANLKFEQLLDDGARVSKGEIAFHVSGSSRSILSTERLVLNFMQRMSGIATKTDQLARLIAHTDARLLDTRKTTPGIRLMEKWAVEIGGGMNHRFALYDMVMIKDNHVDYAGGIKEAIENCRRYLTYKQLDLKVEIEVRNNNELQQVLDQGGVDRIMLDNYSPSELAEALKLIDHDLYETEASGGIDETTIAAYAETGVNFISSGAITHSFKSLDMSLKAEFS